MHEPWQHGAVEVAHEAAPHGKPVRLHYVAQGEGKLVVLLHGFPECWYSWRYQIPWLARRFKVVAPDLRGYNESDKPGGVEAYRIEHLVADVLGLIRACGYDRAMIVGHDWGGIIAWYLAAHYPDVSERLVILNAPHPTAFQRHLPWNLRQLRRSWYVVFFQLPWLPEALFRLVRRRVIAEMVSRAERHDRMARAAAIERYVAAIDRHGALTAALNYYRAAFRDYLRRWPPPLPAIRCPTQIIWGEDDCALGRELTERLDPYFSDGYEIRYVPHGSHWVQQEHPTLVNECIENFLLQKTS